MIYTIKQNHHYASRRPFIPYFKNELRFIVRFDDSAYYDPVITDYNHAYDVNKLYGFREGITGRNSARIGWNCIGGRIWLYPYVHIDGDILNHADAKAICEVKPYEDIECRIKCYPKNYLFQVGNTKVSTERGEGSWLKFIEHPFFGGHFPAQHDTKIKIVRY
jgi:hypothetical protein